MISIDELELRILATLEEAGSEDFDQLLYFASSRQGTPGELSEFLAALGSLLNKGHIQVSDETTAFSKRAYLSDAAGLTMLKNLSSVMHFDVEAKMWRFTGLELSKSRQPDVRLTESGKLAAREILSRRGYQWWAQPK